ncbi:hypothetical protein ILUMI_09266 [Ignelater luminosus]|uniref:Uncharacterized protein n=1 Tax=Ignelater luminosus TaxID=2038154 RepID=A0A8K0GEP6_IGNLU|nr:hypothetical protein ILUMI_09266 [Ignelater luminosus]
MGHLTSIFIVLVFITALNCAPLDVYSVNPPATAFSTTASTTAVPSSTTEQHIASKRQTKEYSSESRESDESSEENKKRPARDTENSGVIAHEAKQDSSTLGLTQTSTTPATKEIPIPQLSIRETRGVYYDAPGAYAATSQSTTTGAITSSTTAATSSTTNNPN